MIWIGSERRDIKGLVMVVVAAKDRGGGGRTARGIGYSNKGEKIIKARPAGFNGMVRRTTRRRRRRRRTKWMNDQQSTHGLPYRTLKSGFGHGELYVNNNHGGSRRKRVVGWRELGLGWYQLGCLGQGGRIPQSQQRKPHYCSVLFCSVLNLSLPTSHFKIVIQ